MKTTIPKSQLRRTLVVLIVALVLVVLVLGGEVLSLRRALVWVDHTDEVIAADYELVRLTVDLETGWRGYLMTQDEAYLQPYRDARVLIGPRFDALNQLVSDNPGQQRKLAKIRSQCMDWIRQADPGDPGTLRPPEFFVKNSTAAQRLWRKTQMDRMRAQHGEFTAIEQGLLKQRLDAAHSGEESIDVLLLLVCFLGAGAVTLALKQTRPLAGKRLLQYGASPDEDQNGKEGPSSATSKGKWRTWAQSAAVVLALPAIAVVLSIPLRSYNPYPFVLFYGAVSLVAWTEGLWWGFVSLALSLGLADYFLIVPYGSLSMDFKGALGLVLCACVQLLICWMIDSQKRAARVLREQAGLLDLSHDCIMIRDLDGRVRFWNYGAEEMFGFSAQEAWGRIAEELLQTVFPLPLAEIGAHLRKYGRWEGELHCTTRDGARIAVDSRWVLQKMRDGAAPRVMEVNQDITERRLQEKALRKNEAFLEQTGRMAELGGWEIDLATKEMNWAAETYRILRMDPSHRPTVEEALDLYTAESRPVIVAALEKAFVDGEGWDLELGLTRSDGKPIWARVVGKVEFTNGKPVRLVGATQDITARADQRRALQDANERATMAAESSGIGIWDWDLRSDKFNCDAFLYQIFGLNPECCESTDLAYWAGRVHPEDRAGVERALKDGIAGIRPYATEFRTVWDDGSLHYIKATGKVIRDQYGLASRMVGTNMEITESKLAEQALRDQASLLDLSHDAIMVRDFDGAIQFWNKGAEEMYGFTARDTCGRLAQDLLKTVFPQTMAAIDADLLQYGRWDGELRHTTRDGAHIVVDSRWVLQQIADGAAPRVLEINSEITNRKKAEEALLAKTEDLLRSNKELDEFAYAASHDLKAPLRVIFNASKWLEEDLEKYLTAETRSDMDLMRRRVVRMEKLLDDLLEYSRIGRKTSERREEILTADKLMENILGLISLPEGFTLSLSPKLAGIRVKRMPLQQILINLIGNAVKHHDKETGSIEVSVEDLGTQFEFAVRDDGPGIPAEFHEQIFKMFQTLKPRDQVEGSGMGLAMVRKYVQFAGGKITVESTEGHGSTFRFTWPKQQQLEEEPS